MRNVFAVLLHVVSGKAVQQRLGCGWTHQCGKHPSFCAQQSPCLLLEREHPQKCGAAP